MRDYGTALWDGGDAACDHTAKQPKRGKAEYTNGQGSSFASNLQAWGDRDVSTVYRDTCGKCGAVRVDRQIGLERDPAEYLATMVGVFREVRRVLRKDGTCWVNMGDSYASTPSGSFDKGGRGSGALEGGGFRSNKAFSTVVGGLKPKDLLLMPARLALALQADGWWIRSDVIWHKPNPMPESCTDRPTSAHEHVFLITKSARYYYDADAVREPHAEGTHSRGGEKTNGRDALIKSGHWNTLPPTENPAGRNLRNVWTIATAYTDGRATQAYSDGRTPWHSSERRDGEDFTSRNLRNVWTIATHAYPEAHFACVDQETECLTTTGWKRHEELRNGMIAAQFDIASQMLSWAPVEDVARYDVTDQPMVVGSSRDIDMWLTPNHRTVIQRRHPRTRSLLMPVIIRADELLASHSVPTAAGWNYVGDASIPQEWAELLGWYVAEGHESKDSLAVELYQSETANPTKCKRIEELLRQTGAEWTKATASRQWRGTVTQTVAYRIMGYAAVRLREMAPGKLLPWGSILWSAERIGALVDGLIGGDGHTRLDGRRCFVQKNLDQCALMQALAIRLGYSANVTVRQDGIGVVYITRHRTRSFRGTNGRGSKPRRQTYTGTVWCPKLPLGTWVARRNGKPFITGNTFPPELAERCIKAGTSERGCCAACGKPWVRTTDTSYERNRHGYSGRTEVSGSNGWDGGSYLNLRKVSTTTGWSPGCDHEAGVVPCTVLDPFIGAGTTALVADRLQRDVIGIDLNTAYTRMAMDRCIADAPLFTSFAPAEPPEDMRMADLFTDIAAD